MRALELVSTWPVPHVAAAAVRADGTVLGATGDVDHRFRLASLTKPIAAVGDARRRRGGHASPSTTPVGQPGCTLRHLLAHAGGYPFDGADAGRRPGSAGASTPTPASSSPPRTSPPPPGSPFADYLGEAVLAPLGMTRLLARGLAGARRLGDRADVVAFLAESMRPTLLAASDRRRRRPAAVAGPRRYRAGGGPLRSVPVGVGLRDPGAQATALDWPCEQRGHVRSLRWVPAR